jgi:hypothetical protein
MAMLFLAQRASITLHAVEMVVEPLRDREELLVAFDDQPARVDARTPNVGEEHLEHLGYAATDGGRVDAHDGTTEGLTQTVGPFEQRLDPPGLDHLAENPRINDRERHLLHERPPSRDQPRAYGGRTRLRFMGAPRQSPREIERRLARDLDALSVAVRSHSPLPYASW